MYNCFVPGSKLFYTTNEGYLRGMRIDSISVIGADTIYYPYHSARNQRYFSDIGNFDSTGASWLGKKVVSKPDGTFLFDNLWGDTVQIMTKANVGDTWMFFDDTTDISYLATVTSKDTMTILGGLDSVKKIRITAKRAGSVNTSDPVHNFEIILSKSHGFADIFDLYTFPYHYPDSFNDIRHADYYLDLLLDNLGDGDLGVHFDNLPNINNSVFHQVRFYNPRMNEIHHYQVGDVFESQIETNNVITGDFSQVASIDTIVSITPAGSDTIYYLEHHTNTFAVTAGSFSITYAHVPYNIVADSNYLVLETLMPEEWRSPHFYHFFQNPFVTSGCYSPFSYSVNKENIDYNSNTLIGLGSDGFQIQFSNHLVRYKIGFGIDSTFDFSPVFQIITSGYQFFAHKSGTTCFGTVVPITVVEKVTWPEAQINIYPNPASSLLTLSANYHQHSQVTLYDVLGQMVFSSDWAGTEINVNVDNLVNGVYLLNVTSDNGKRITRQVLISH